MTNYFDKSLSGLLYKPSSNLFSKPNQLDGISTIMNLGGNTFDFKYSKSSFGADINSIRRDWRVIGKDLHNAMGTLITESK